MKCTKRMLILLVVVCAFFCNFVFPVAAAQIAEDPTEEVGTQNVGPIYMVDAAGNQYGRSDWPSLQSAKNYYGHDWNYSACSVYYGGGYFNYCYDFSNATKMFFGVRF